MAFNPRDYPPDWSAIKLELREAAGWRCVWCNAVHGQPHPVTGSRVILTTAHLCHDKQCSDRDHLACLCMNCHLAYDADHHRRNAAETRRKRKAAADLFHPAHEDPP